MRIFTTVLGLVFFVSSCGFQPLYVEKKHSNAWYFGGDFDTSISEEMAQVKVEPIEERFGQIIRNELLDNLTPRGVPSHPKYRLFVALKEKSIVQQALRNDITATREQVKYTVEYIMYNTSEDKELVRGNSVSYASYDIMSNPYSTTVASKKAEKDSANIIANDIALRIGAYFHAQSSKRGGSGAI